ncbi:MAG: histidine--tRNA ligase [Candidatus Pacebacteria bacterium]|nr:histidine--tRNA ligase [Candidatus Paceibacterota bacterium]
MTKIKFQTPSGMHDILPEEEKYYYKIEEIARKIADFYGFGKIHTPIVEQVGLFEKSVGNSTDIVQKEMYTLKTKGNDWLALRPEGTAPIARSYIENGMYNLSQPVKLWYFGPFFRYERPQAGRYRQFWQLGFEALGEKSSIVDAQIIQICYNLLKELKIKNVIVELNSIGDKECRPSYKKILASYLKKRQSSLCSDCKKRRKDNVLRVLDCKEDKCQSVKADAPQTLDYLCEECKKHFKEVLEYLDEIELPYSLNSSLVRGLDYYTKTVFEIFAKDSLEKSIALAGGGRYDDLINLLGGRNVPACGAAFGIERVIELMRKQEIIDQEPEVQIFLAQIGELAKKKSLNILEEFRKTKIKIAESFGRDSLRNQLNKANKLKAKYVLIFGQKEALDNQIVLRDMETGKQALIKLDNLIKEIKKKLKK